LPRNGHAHLSLRAGRPVWLPPGSARRITCPALRGRHAADVAIVGGGITGAIAALTFARAGIRVALLEAARIGCGSTAASSALLLQEPDHGLQELTDRYGPAAARRLWQLSRDSARALVALLRDLAIPCDLAERDTIYYTIDAGGVDPLHAEHAARGRAGIAAEWLEPRALRTEVGIPARAAIRSRGNAHCDPFRACEGVIRAAAAAGAAVFERSPVRRIETSRDAVVVRTGAGAVRAAQVVIATGYATPLFRPLAGRFEAVRTYVAATAPLGVRERRELGLADVMLWDTRRPYHYARWTADRRLLLGGGDRPLRGGPPAPARIAAARDAIRAHFEPLLPALAGMTLTHAWEGRFANTRDSLPFIGPHRRYPRHLFALGYGGNGMAFGPLAARILLEQFQGRDSDDHALFRFGR
jgi:glycine/D-amino acid oxidase-like deaminating enzyme